MGGGPDPNLRNSNQEFRSKPSPTVRHYRVTTADARRELLERNLRFKTDSSKDGPEKGAPRLCRRA